MVLEFQLKENVRAQKFSWRFQHRVHLLIGQIKAAPPSPAGVGDAVAQLFLVSRATAYRLVPQAALTGPAQNRGTEADLLWDEMRCTGTN